MKSHETVTHAEFSVDQKIDGFVNEMVGREDVDLPDSKNPLVFEYIHKIEGTYDVSRSKRDTDNAIDLLYIAYNTTPQREGNIRADISDIMNRLVRAQQKSANSMRAAAEDSGRIVKDLKGLFEDWTDVASANESEEFQEFVGGDLRDLAQEIKDKATRISEDLRAIASEYDRIIDDTGAASKKSEKALATRLEDNAEISKRILANNARSAELDTLVNDLQDSILKYQRMADDYKEQAKTAEERSFVMSIVRVGAEMISALVPAIASGVAAASTGGASVVASAATTTAKQQLDAGSSAEDEDEAGTEAEVKAALTEKKADLKKAREKATDLEDKAVQLKQERDDVEKDEELDSDTKSAQVSAYEDRIDSNQKDIDANQQAMDSANEKIESLQNSLHSLSKGMGEISDQQADQAKSLRELQSTMLDKVSDLEDKKRESNAELSNLRVLLAGQRTEKETIQLAIESLNVSLKALKRVQEIVNEIAFFFSSFAAFMDTLIKSTESDSEWIEGQVNRKSFNERRRQRVITRTNEFFVTQCGQWQAVESVSARFAENFSDGWSKLNHLQGNYLTGDELAAYLEQAKARIDEIIRARKAESDRTILRLEEFKDRVKQPG